MNKEELSKTGKEKLFDLKADSTQLDDYHFRKTLTKKNEKLIIDDCLANDPKPNISKDLSTFLTSLNLMNYYNIFFDNCFDDNLSILGKFSC